VTRYVVSQNKCVNPPKKNQSPFEANVSFNVGSQTEQLDGGQAESKITQSLGSTQRKWTRPSCAFVSRQQHPSVSAVQFVCLIGLSRAGCGGIALYYTVQPTILLDRVGPQSFLVRCSQIAKGA
jgi:hypothetical protein